MTTRAYRVRHRTKYAYGAPMSDGYSVACLMPRLVIEAVRLSPLGAGYHELEVTVANAGNGTLYVRGTHYSINNTTGVITSISIPAAIGRS